MLNGAYMADSAALERTADVDPVLAIAERQPNLVSGERPRGSTPQWNFGVRRVTR
jgi:hypothetical protein